MQRWSRPCPRRRRCGALKWRCCPRAAAGVQEMEVEVEGGEMEVKDGEMEVSPEPAVAVGGTELEAHPDEEDEVSDSAQG